MYVQMSTGIAACTWIYIFPVWMHAHVRTELQMICLINTSNNLLRFR